MIDISKDLVLALAQRALQDGELPKCRNLLLSMKGAIAATKLLAEVNYRLGQQATAAGQYAEARSLFADAIQHHPDSIVHSLAQERNRLINRIIAGEQPSVVTLRKVFKHVFVKTALRVGAGMLRPEIQYVGCAAAYRSGYDDQSNDPLSLLIRLIKHGVEDGVIARLGQYLSAYVYSETPVLATTDLIIPVPTHPERESARGYSIPGMLAEQVSVLCAVPMHDDVVRTAGDAIELRKVPRWYRKYAVQNAFKVSNKAHWLDGRTVLVIDDVMTTGSTLREVARVMLANGARQVFAIALSHTESSVVGG